MKELIVQGGPLIWALGALSVYGLGVVAERLFFFHRIRINVKDLLHGIGSLVRRGSFAEAIHEASRAPGSAARVIEATLIRSDLERPELREIAHEAAELEVSRIERNIRGLLAVATVSPLIGMLGTTLGLVQYYTGLEGNPDQSGMLHENIGSALLLSALGLAIAIPAYLFYMFLAAKARKAIGSLQRAGVEIVNIICDARQYRAGLAPSATPSGSARAASPQRQQSRPNRQSGSPSRASDKLPADPTSRPDSAPAAAQTDAAPQIEDEDEIPDTLPARTNPKPTPSAPSASPSSPASAPENPPAGDSPASSDSPSR